jgi:hypothetical protein
VEYSDTPSSSSAMELGLLKGENSARSLFVLDVL